VAAITTAAIAAVLGIIYAAAISSRRALRWPLVTAALTAFSLAIAAGLAGESLLAAVKANGSTAEIAAAEAHAHSSDALTVAAFVFAVAVLATVWSVLRPACTRWSRAMAIGTATIALGACATLVTAAIVLAKALEAVSTGHPSWNTR
jgi:hypothetical protein